MKLDELEGLLAKVKIPWTALAADEGDAVLKAPDETMIAEFFSSVDAFCATVAINALPALLAVARAAKEHTCHAPCRGCEFDLRDALRALEEEP